MPSENSSPIQVHGRPDNKPRQKSGTIATELTEQISATAFEDWHAGVVNSDTTSGLNLTWQACLTIARPERALITRIKELGETGPELLVTETGRTCGVERTTAQTHRFSWLGALTLPARDTQLT